MPDDQISFDALAASGSLQFGDGYRTKRTEYGRPGYPILRVAEVLNGSIVPRSEDYVRVEFKPSMGSKVSCPGDVILTTKGTVGRVAMMPADAEEFVYSPQLCYFRPQGKGPLDHHYLYYWFKSDLFSAQAKHRKSQTDMADYINLADIRSLIISLPAKHTQQAVAETLRALDDKIAADDRIAVGAWNLAQAHFESITKEARSTAALGSLIDLVYGKALREPDRRLGPVPVFGCTGQVGWHDAPLSRAAGAVVGRKGANAGTVTWSPRSCWVIDTAFYVEPKTPETTAEFAYFLLKNASLDGLVGDSAVPGLNRHTALAHPVRLPGQSAIECFTGHSRILLAAAEAATSQNRTLAEIRDALLPKLMSGEIRVRDAEKIVEDVT